MKPIDLSEEIAVELEAMEMTVDEIVALQRDTAHREPTTREKTAAAAFLAQFYNGLENIFKRIYRYYSLDLPTSETWHVELFQSFCSPSNSDLPQLFEEDLAVALAPYRRFRHVAFHSYGFQLDWSRMAYGVENVEKIFEQIKSSLSDYLRSVDD
jgi:hypothetical protein